MLSYRFQQCMTVIITFTVYKEKEVKNKVYTTSSALCNQFITMHTGFCAH